MIKMLDFNYPIGSTPSFLYIDLYLNIAYTAHCYSTFISLFRFTKLEVCT